MFRDDGVEPAPPESVGFATGDVLVGFEAGGSVLVGV